MSNSLLARVQDTGDVARREPHRGSIQCVEVTKCRDVLSAEWMGFD